jgi:hypothetical protein
MGSPPLFGRALAAAVNAKTRQWDYADGIRIMN